MFGKDCLGIFIISVISKLLMACVASDGVAAHSSLLTTAVTIYFRTSTKMSTTPWTRIPNLISRLTNDESRRVRRTISFFDAIIYRETV